jgi:predicted ester cyclase
MEEIMSGSESKQLIGRYLQALSGQDKTAAVVDRFVSDAGLAEHIRVCEAAFPRYELVAEEIVAEGNMVSVRGTFSGVHRAAFAGIPPTGKHVSAGLQIMYRLENNKIAEHWLQFDMPTLLAQLNEPVRVAS